MEDNHGRQNNRIAELAKHVQDESRRFSCASALFGLTKIIFDKERGLANGNYWEDLLKLTDKLAMPGVSPSEAEAINAQIRELTGDKKNTSPKFFYIDFYDNNEERFFSSPGARIRWDEADSIYWIYIPEDIKSAIAGDANANGENHCVVVEQRHMIAHEMAHEYFEFLDPEGKEKLNTCDNAEEFAKELLKFRKFYCNGIACQPEVNIDKEKFTMVVKECLLSMTDSLHDVDFHCADKSAAIAERLHDCCVESNNCEENRFLHIKNLY